MTLVYLAVQVTNSAKVFKLSSFDGAKEQFNQVNMTIAANPELGELWAKGGASFRSLDVGERVRFRMIVFAYFNIFERLFLESRERSGSGLWAVEEQTVVNFLAQMPGMAHWWEENPTSYSPEFRACVDGLLADEGRMGAAKRRGLSSSEWRSGATEEGQ